LCCKRAASTPDGGDAPSTSTAVVEPLHHQIRSLVLRVDLVGS
jgi:hypothetical protein